MTVATRMTRSQKRRAFREAVRLSLVEFYDTPEPDSKRLVSAWWKRLTSTSALKTDLFMHSEPINVAADLIQAKAIPITSQIEGRYHAVLESTRESTLHTIGAAKHTQIRRSEQPTMFRSAQQNRDFKEPSTEARKKAVLHKHLTASS